MAIFRALHIISAISRKIVYYVNMIKIKFKNFNRLKGIQLQWKKIFTLMLHPNEARIVLKSKSSIEEYEFEDKNKLNFKNNIYLGTISG